MSPATTRKRKSDEGKIAESKVQSSTPKQSKRQKNLPVRAKDGESLTDPSTAQAKGTLITFGDDDDEPVSTLKPASPKASPKTAEAEEVPDSDIDSDDEAPEAVSTSRAAEDIKKSAQAAQKAAQQLAAEKKRKRQERDTLFKHQAEERKQAQPAAAKETDSSEDEQDEALPATRRQAESLGGRKRQENIHIPNTLPAEFLTDSSTEDEDDDDIASINPRSKKRKVSAIERRFSRMDRAPRDERVGSTVYRVAKKTDERLAPKAKKYSKSTKDILLKRNRSAAKPRGGFLVKK